jgi:uncharacterized protein YndB with AHSA1/START domain
MKNLTTAERKSDREMVVTRTFDAPARLVWEAWTKPELFKRWWVPKSVGITMLSCDVDARVGGQYRLVMRLGDTEPRAFFGTYLEVVPSSRLVWTNDEGEAQVITTVTFEEKAGKTYLVMHDLYASKQALDDAIATGSTSGDMTETFGQLDEALATLARA